MALRSAQELKERLQAGERFLSDGAIGSELIRCGVAPEDILRANLGMPDEVRSLHERYLAAGSAILTTNTFGLRSGSDWASAIRAGLALAHGAAHHSAKRASVWVSLTPQLFLPELSTFEFLAESSPHWPQAILIETCMTLENALAATRAARRMNARLLAVTCSFTAEGQMADGTLPEQAALQLLEAGADMVGGNCGETPETFLMVAQRMRAVTQAPLLFQPSAGLPVQDAEGRWVYPTSPEAFAEIGLRLFEAGVSIVGGCCGTTPAYIAALRAKTSPVLIT